MGILERQKVLPLTWPLHHRAHDVAPVPNDVNEAGAGENVGDQLERPGITPIVRVVGVLVTPVTRVGRKAAIEVADQPRQDGPDVLDEGIVVRNQQAIVLGQDRNRVVKPAKYPRLMAQEDVGMRVEDLLQVSRPGTRGAVDDDRVRLWLASVGQCSRTALVIL
jgi:hypothetical protein